MEIEEKIYKLKVKKAAKPDDVSARNLKYAGVSITPSLASLFKHSADACKPPDQSIPEGWESTPFGIYFPVVCHYREYPPPHPLGIWAVVLSQY